MTQETYESLAFFSRVSDFVPRPPASVLYHRRLASVWPRSREVRDQGARFSVSISGLDDRARFMTHQCHSTFLVKTQVTIELPS